MTEEEIVRFGNVTEKKVLKIQLHPKRVQSASKSNRKKESKQSMVDTIVTRAYLPEMQMSVENETGEKASWQQMKEVAYIQIAKDKESIISQKRKKLLSSVNNRSRNTKGSGES
jgi:hypothetical protein